MIKHIVLFKLKDREAESIEKAKNTLLDMKGKIKELKHIEVGIDVTNSNRSYDIAILTKFNSVQDLEAYQNSPLHIGVAEYMVSIGESIVTVDYEI
ncbi:MAG: Dabb family protein [Methanobacterium sp.]